MTTVEVAALQPGDRVHVGPHDIYRGRADGPPMHKDTRPADVTVDELVPLETIGVIMCHPLGEPAVKGAAVYDLNDELERVA